MRASATEMLSLPPWALAQSTSAIASVSGLGSSLAEVGDQRLDDAGLGGVVPQPVGADQQPAGCGYGERAGTRREVRAVAAQPLGDRVRLRARSRPPRAAVPMAIRSWATESSTLSSAGSSLEPRSGIQ